MDFGTLVPGKAGLSGVAADALLLVVVGDAAGSGVDDPLGKALKAALADGDFTPKAGQVLYLHRVAGVKAGRVALAWAPDATPKALRRAVAGGVAVLKGGGTRHLAVAVAGGELGAAQAEAVVSAVTDAAYLYRATKPSAGEDPKLARTSVVCARGDEKSVVSGLARGQAIAAGVRLARECANRPGNVCTPGYLAGEARKLGKEHGLKVEVLDRKDCTKLGMGAFMAVAQGSEEPPVFIVARYQGAGRDVPPLVLVGKGITFDSGGISIKPAAEMDEMKFDMGGAASVLGTLKAVAALGARVNLIGLIPACENLPGGRAVKPGDVVTSLSGQTIEILNTDAEGRLILCDALTYAERYDPAAVIDIATLTGACVIALGHVATGLFSNRDALAAELVAAGEAAWDRVWHMPLWDDYQEQLKSPFADMANIGGRPAGSVTAACFLSRYARKYPWAHLDIAGTAWKSGRDKGSTGRPVALLTRFVMGRAAR